MKGRFNTPQVVELHDSNVIMVKQTESNFIVLDGSSLSSYSYEGRQQSQTKYTFSLLTLQRNQITANSKYCILIGKKNYIFYVLNYTFTILSLQFLICGKIR